MTTFHYLLQATAVVNISYKYCNFGFGKITNKLRVGNNGTTFVNLQTKDYIAWTTFKKWISGFT